MATGLVQRAITRFPVTFSTARAILNRSQASGAQTPLAKSEFGSKPVSDLKTFHIYRWNSNNPDKPKLHDYKINLKECGPMVLDTLIMIENEIDPTLTFCYSCHKGICYSCAMNIDGWNELASLTKISSVPSCMISPLQHMFVINYLVVDMTKSY
ncbi:Succinate dehydrogenase [ubiquinone] iron-sulfur subunit 1 [Forsythia ovata]|uniref:Succinate dehydrogenase [ubiquinone] iron-sulfur subunit 1 n=1 Tax=Forsythia ovata TaxID=205694 RepID=A0ABD1UCZ5_9LAMI